MIPQPKARYKDSDTVAQYQQSINEEAMKSSPCEDRIVDSLRCIATELYRETDIKSTVTAQIAKRRAEMMKMSEDFNPDYFKELISYITLNQQGRTTLYTKTETTIPEGEENGCKEDS